MAKAKRRSQQQWTEAALQGSDEAFSGCLLFSVVVSGCRLKNRGGGTRNVIQSAPNSFQQRRLELEIPYRAEPPSDPSEMCER